MKSAIRIRVAAPPRLFYELARDVPRWQELLPHYRRVLVQARRDGRILAQMVAVRRFGPLDVPVTWRAVHWSEDEDPLDLRLRFHHLRGVTGGMDVTWHIVPENEGCSVTIEHEFQRGLPLLGPEFLPRLVDRLFTRPIAGRTLRAFKALAEMSDNEAAVAQ
jgi:ribosome-associated toxin RatA of RatAB toxin-antitoxin module